MGMAKADYIAGLAKGLAVLEAFDTERQRLNATLAAQRTGITRAAARRPRCHCRLLRRRRLPPTRRAP
jgi:IclR family pca regulon transcriptional regulator